LFKRPKEGDNWVEQVKYVKPEAREVLTTMWPSAVMEYNKSTVSKQQPEPYYGDKDKKLAEQMAKFVDRQHVPDNYAILRPGASGLLTSFLAQNANRVIHYQPILSC
jgi:hypothetical protein